MAACDFWEADRLFKFIKQSNILFNLIEVL